MGVAAARVTSKLGTALVASLMLVASCGEASSDRTAVAGESGVDGAATPLQRRGRFGSLRDFVLISQPQDPPGAALLVDRFEVTQDDWAQFADTDVGGQIASGVTTRGAGALPASNMNLLQARAFARWRLGRLPSVSEWRRVTVGGGNSPFPWGFKEFATHANTGDLGMGEAMPVGTFESGRRAGGNMPYDLIGNVREWTETVPTDWSKRQGPQGSRSFLRVRRDALRSPALSVWMNYGLVPLGIVANVGAGDVPRKVVGADFVTPMRDVIEHLHDTQVAGERSQRTGLRVYTTVDELLARLLAMTEPPTTEERRQLVRFVHRNGHGPLLLAAFEQSLMADVSLPRGSIGSVLAAELRSLATEPR